MKKFALVLSVIILAAAFITACAPPAQPAQPAQSSESAAQDKPVKVACLINGTLGDKSWFDSCARGMEEIKTAYNVETKIIEAGLEKTAWEPALIDLSEQDWDLIICSTGDMQEIVERVAPDYLEKKYILFDAVANGDNVYSAEFKQNEASFLAGALGALVTTSQMEGVNDKKIIGVVGGMDLPIINDFICGYIQGAQYVDPDTKVAVSYAGSFGDPTKGKELAISQIGMGADIVYQVAGGTGLGVLQAAAEKGVYSIGVDSDQAMILKDSDAATANRIVTSILKSVDKMIVKCVGDYIAGTLKFGQSEKLGVKEDAMGFVRNDIYKGLVSAESQAKMEEIEKKVADGSIEVKSVLDISAEETAQILASAKP